MNTHSVGRISLSTALVPFFIGCTNDIQFSDSQGSSAIPLRSGEYSTEGFVQGYASNKLDILFIDDNSGSMLSEQEKLGDRIGSFLSRLYDVDWRIGVTTTDVSDGPYGLKGRLLPWGNTGSQSLMSSTPNYERLFRETIVRSETFNCGQVCPSGDEQPLRATQLALSKRNSENAGFFREGADLGVLILSDEDERSDGQSNDALRPERLLESFRDIWGDDKSIFVYAMVIRPGDTDCMNQQNNQGNYGNIIARLVELTGGLLGSICEDDYSETLGQISEHARKLLDYVQLKYSPAADTVEVSFNPEHSTPWHVVGKRLYLDNPPPKGTRITVHYMVN